MKESLLTITLSHEGRVFEGAVNDLLPTGLAADFASGPQPALADGDEVEIEVQAEGRPTPLSATVVVAKFPANKRGSWRFEFYFEGPACLNLQNFLASTRLDIWSHFNRRLAYRLRTEERKDSIVRLWWRGGWTQSKLHDISTLGFSLLLRFRDSARLPSEEQPGAVGYRCRIDVPEIDIPLVFAVSFVGRIELRSKVRAGFAFDPERSVRFDRNQGLISRYVMACQQERMQPSQRRRMGTNRRR